MKTCDNDYYIFVASKDASNTTYILKTDGTVREEFKRSVPLTILPNNLFDDLSALRKANRGEYEIKEFDHNEYDHYESYPVYKNVKVKLKFKPVRVNVKMSYFEDEVEDE